MEDDQLQFDVLQWWIQQRTKYKVLALMANDVIIVQMTVAASEYAFIQEVMLLMIIEVDCYHP